MTSSSFYEQGSKVLTPGAFEFVLDSELKRAVRSQNFLTLVTVEASREWEGMTARTRLISSSVGMCPSRRAPAMRRSCSDGLKYLERNASFSA